MRVGLKTTRWCGAVLAIALIGATLSGPAFPDEVFQAPPSYDDRSPWGKDPFLRPADSPNPPSTGDEPSGSPVELQGVIAGPSGVVAILNHDIVRVGDRVNGETVVEITPSAIVLKRGQQLRRVVIRPFALP